jgi:proline iminopeptidase
LCAVNVFGVIGRIRRILGTDKLVLAGHSFGGLLAALYAAEFPQHVKALILVAPADLLVMPQAGGGLFGDIERRLPPAMKAGYADFMKRYFDFGGVFAKSDADLWG